jgi:hypothetical protein
VCECRGFVWLYREKTFECAAVGVLFGLTEREIVSVRVSGFCLALQREKL